MSTIDKDDDDRECRWEVYNHCNVSSKAFRVDCPHQDVCAIRDCGLGGGWVGVWWVRHCVWRTLKFWYVEYM